jgi:hypothetical protein
MRSSGQWPGRWLYGGLTIGSEAPAVRRISFTILGERVLNIACPNEIGISANDDGNTATRIVLIANIMYSVTGRSLWLTGDHLSTRASRPSATLKSEQVDFSGLNNPRPLLFLGVRRPASLSSSHRKDLMRCRQPKSVCGSNPPR